MFQSVGLAQWILNDWRGVHGIQCRFSSILFRTDKQWEFHYVLLNINNIPFHTNIDCSGSRMFKLVLGWSQHWIEEGLMVVVLAVIPIPSVALSEPGKFITVVLESLQLLHLEEDSRDILSDRRERIRWFFPSLPKCKTIRDHGFCSSGNKFHRSWKWQLDRGVNRN